MKHTREENDYNDKGTILSVLAVFNRLKGASFPQNITSKASQQYIKGISNGGQFEEEHTLVTYHRSTSSLLKLNSGWFYPQIARIIIHSHRRVHIQSVQV